MTIISTNASLQKNGYFVPSEIDPNDPPALLKRALDVIDRLGPSTQVGVRVRIAGFMLSSGTPLARLKLATNTYRKWCRGISIHTMRRRKGDRVRERPRAPLSARRLHRPVRFWLRTVDDGTNCCSSVSLAFFALPPRLPSATLASGQDHGVAPDSSTGSSSAVGWRRGTTSSPRITLPLSMLYNCFSKSSILAFSSI